MLGNRTLKFQTTWYEKFPWVHVSSELGGVLCFTCVDATLQNLTGMAKYQEDTFISTGFKNWKKAIEKCQKHEKSDAHRISISNLISRKKSLGVDLQLSKQNHESQLSAQKALVKILSSLQYLAQQGLAIRGKETISGNFNALLQLRGSDDDNLKTWLERKTSYTSGAHQNEMLQLTSHEILRNICYDIKSSSDCSVFGVIIDGTQDCTGREQESICIRYVDGNFDVREEFLGLYELSSTTGSTLCSMLKDVLIRYQLPIENLRAQTYDGASNMAGKYRGCQAEVKKLQPLALYTHCGAHVSHLIVSKAVQSAAFIRNALDHLQELGKLYKSSGKFKNLYLDLHDDVVDHASPGRLKPICPTRWLTHSASIRAFLDNYEDVIKALGTASAEFGTNVASRATGVMKCVSSVSCILGLLAALPIIQCLEKFNRALQSSKVTISGMIESAGVVGRELQRLRSEECFKSIFDDAHEKAAKWHLDPLEIRQRRIPAKYAGDGEQLVQSTEEKFRSEYYKVLDSAATNLDHYFASTDIDLQNKLASMLLNGEFHADLVSWYPELSDNLKISLPFFRDQFHSSSVEGYRQIFKSMNPAVRAMFGEVEALLRLLLVSPASSTEAERSFSAMRRLKTWLRSTMTQQRLNHVMVCLFHRERLAQLKPEELAEKFVGSSDSRPRIFGRFL
ncbi:zinc finger MYM-type protein 1-like [Apostichopus japonicus]|uniref:zinc finger MYM-type protein 1-like n=1 Tax=Stichopus japonicus TaxID=307972 RepID=UPI003AB5EA7B